MTRSASVAAVVLTHNRAAYLQRCVGSIRAQTPPVEHLIVVDNASTDGTREFLDLQPDLTVIRLSVNSGSAGGFRAGIDAAARTDAAWWWIMDDDCAAAADALSHLCAACGDADTRIGGASPKVIFSDGAIRCGLTWDRAAPQPSGDAPIPIDWAPFLGLLLRAAACREVGPVRTDFFMWNDDAEYCLRLRKAGWSFVGVPRAEFTHPALAIHRRQLFGRTIQYPAGPPWRMYYGARNSLVVARMREETALGRARMMVRFFAREVGRMLIWATAARTHGGHIWMRSRGLLDGLRGRMGARVLPGTTVGDKR